MPKRIVLVHGAWLGGWCWQQVADLLRSSGAQVSASDLPAHGDDTTPVAQATLDAYVDRIAADIPADGAPVALCGHSMGGIVLSTLAERMPDRIGVLIYVAAYLLRNGESITQVSQWAKDSLIPQSLEFAPDYSVGTITDAMIAEVFCADAPTGDLARVRRLTRPEPLAPFNSALALSRARFGRVPRAYIRTAADRAVTRDLQEHMLEQLPCADVRTMHTSHTPFFAAPRELAMHILELSR